ncbi:MAG: hypothetical protein IJ546_08845 [Prevotella sp.]|nr:hypothetical protein [Prevotella sp.]
MKRLLLWIPVLLMTMSMTARPNWPDMTDGTFIFATEGGQYDKNITLHSYGDGKDYYLFMTTTEEHSSWRTISDPSTLEMPPGYHVGDSVYYDGEIMLFFNAKGQFYSSMQPTRCDKAEEELTNSRMALLLGYYEWSKGHYLSFTLDNDRKPQLRLSDDFKDQPEEKIEFGPDVKGPDGTMMLNVVTPKRRWLVQLTTKGINIYKAVKSRQGGSVQWKRGALMMRARVDNGYHLAPYRVSYFEDRPLLHVLSRHCSTAMLDYLLSQFDPEKKDEYQQYRALLQLIRGHVTK